MPPKGKRIASDPNAFLFVNEDFSTLFGGTKNADLDRHKQSHVQRQSFAKRRKSQRDNITSSATSPAPGEYGRQSGPRSIPPPLISHPDGRAARPSFPVSDNRWPPAVSAGASTVAAESERSFDDPLISQWRSSVPHISPESPYSPLQSDEFQSRWSQQASTYAFPLYSAMPISIETSAGQEDVLRFPPLTPTSSSDPFNNLQLALEMWAPELMRYYTSRIMPEFFCTDLQATSLHDMRHAEHLHGDMRSCMSNPAEMYALLAATSCHALERDGKLDLPALLAEDSVRVTLLFMSKAFEALRLRLSSGEVSQAIVIAIRRITCAAFYTDNFAAVEAHYCAVMSMIETLGGLETFDDLQKELLIMHDLVYALSTGSPPRMDLTWDPGELVGGDELGLSVHTKRTKSNVGQHLQSMARYSGLALDSVVVGCASDLVETQLALESLRERSYQPSEYRWLAHKRLAIVHRLLNVDKGSAMRVSEVLRLALLYYCVLARIIPYNSNVLIDQYLESELQQWQAQSMQDAFGQSRELLLWSIVMFGIGIATRENTRNTFSGEASSQQSLSPRMGSGQTPEGSRDFVITGFVEEIGREICRKLRIVNEAQLRSLVRLFLFDERFVDDRYLTFSEGLLSGAEEFSLMAAQPRVP